MNRYMRKLIKMRDTNKITNESFDELWNMAGFGTGDIFPSSKKQKQENQKYDDFANIEE